MLAGDATFERLVNRIVLLIGCGMPLDAIHARVVDAGEASEEAFFLAFKGAELIVDSVHSDL